MLINQTNLATVFEGFQTAFRNGISAAPAQWREVAMRVQSSTREEEYGWVGQTSGIREWIGDRVINGLAVHDYKIKNRDFEKTVEVDRNDIEDDRVGLLGPIFEQMGAETAQFPDELVFPLMANGFVEEAYDGQPFFDTDHPVIGRAGDTFSVANTDGGDGAPWFLIDSSKAIKPMIFQERRLFDFVHKDRPEDDNVFSRKQFLYGVDGRMNVGFGFWQLAWGSKQELSAANYEAARAAMMAFTRDGGTKLGVRPDTLVVGPSLEGAARRLLMGGDRVEEPDSGFFVTRSNEWKDSARLVVSPFL